MILVKTCLKRSAIHGIGLFADEFIPRGTVVWKFLDGFDRLISPDYVAVLPPVAQQHMRHFCALLKHSGLYLMTADNDRFINHSDAPNCQCKGEIDDLIAIQDIHKGEEITENYLIYCMEI